MTKVFSFAAIALLALGEGASFAYAVTEETTTTTTANEKVLKTQEIETSSGENVTSSSEEVVEETTSSSEAATESSTEVSEEKEEQKEKSKATRGAADPVNIPDNNLYQIIREILNRPTGYNQGIPDGTAITEAQMEMLTQINRTGVSTLLDTAVIGNLEGIQYATNLESLVLNGKSVDDTFTSLPTGFSNLKKLKTLKFSDGLLKNIDELKDHPALETFSAVQNELDSLSGLSGCKELKYLNIDGSQNSSYGQNSGIQNFKGLEASTKLREIYFRKYDEQRSATEVGNPEPTYVGKGLQSLEGLNCANSLETLELTGHPGLHTLDGLENYKELKTLRVLGAANFNGRDHYYTNPGGASGRDFDPLQHTPTYHKRGLRGSNALDALSNCTALETVNLSENAIEDITSLSGKTLIKELSLSVNLIQTLNPLTTTDNLIKLYADHNLLTNLSGLENANKLEHLNVSAQNAGAYQYQPDMSVGINRIVLRGLLEDISALNPTSLVEFDSSCNRLKDLDVLKTASKLKKLSAYNNRLSDIKGDLAGCSNLESVDFNNNHFVTFKDMGLEGAHDSLKTLNMDQQGLDAWIYGNYQNENAVLVSLEGLDKFTIVEFISMETNQIKDSEMKYIPKCIEDLRIGHNELQDKAFSTFTPTDYSRLTSIFGSHNHISDITPLEKFTTLSRVYFPSQMISVPKHGGTVTKKTSPVGFEVDVLKSDYGVGLNFDKYSGWGPTTPTVKPGTNILDVDDPDYYLEGRSPASEFTYTSNSALSGLTFNGKVFFNADYGIATEAVVELVPTDIDGNEITEIAQGGVIYWRATVKSKDAKYLMKPDFKHHLQYSPHALLDPYVEPLDTQAIEYVKGARVEIDGSYVATPSGIWSQVGALDSLINDSKVANITIVTKVADAATPGHTANMYFNVEGKNFKLVGATKKVTIKSSGPQELKMTVPERFDFGKRNGATQRAKIYTPDAKSHSAKEQTDGFNVRVTDSRKTTNRTDWEVVAQLSDLTNSKSNTLKAGSVAPTLSLKDISLYKMDLTAGTETSIVHGSSGNPIWDKNIELTAGGSSVPISNAASADGEGVWDYRIPFDKVELNVPSNVNDQAGYTFNGKLTWTLNDTL